MDLNAELILLQCRQSYDNHKAAKETTDKYCLGGFTVFLASVVFLASNIDKISGGYAPLSILLVPALGTVYLLIARALLARYCIARWWLVYRQPLLMRNGVGDPILNDDDSFFRVEYHKNQSLKEMPRLVTNAQRQAASAFLILTFFISVSSFFVFWELIGPDRHGQPLFLIFMFVFLVILFGSALWTTQTSFKYWKMEKAFAADFPNRLREAVKSQDGRGQPDRSE